MLRKALDARANYLSVRNRVLELGARDNVDVEFRQAPQQDLRPAQNAFINTLDGIVRYQTERMEESAAQAKNQVKTATRMLLGIGMLVLVSGVFFSIAIGRSITRLAAAASRLTLAIAEGDLSHPIESTARDEMGQLLASLEKMRQALTGEVHAIRIAPNHVGTGSREISHASTDLSRRIAAQAANLERTAASMEEFTATVKQNTAHAKQANALAVDASEVAARGGHAVRGVVDTMHGISESSRKIADIVSVIDSIAFQTNILALNVAVEAARAGEQGRGFAVAAAEVRALAQRSALAAKEIKGLIQQSTDQIDAGATRVEDAGKTMDEIVAAVQRVTGITSEISVASQEQLAGIEQLNQAITQIESAMQQNATVVQQSSAAASSLSVQADSLVASVARFKIGALPRAHAPRAAAAAQPVVATHAGVSRCVASGGTRINPVTTATRDALRAQGAAHVARRWRMERVLGLR